MQALIPLQIASAAFTILGKVKAGQAANSQAKAEAARRMQLAKLERARAQRKARETDRAKRLAQSNYLARAAAGGGAADLRQRVWASWFTPRRAHSDFRTGAYGGAGLSKDDVGESLSYIEDGVLFIETRTEVGRLTERIDALEEPGSLIINWTIDAPAVDLMVKPNDAEFDTHFYRQYIEFSDGMGNFDIFEKSYLTNQYSFAAYAKLEALGLIEDNIMKPYITLVPAREITKQEYFMFKMGGAFALVGDTL